MDEALLSRMPLFASLPRDELQHLTTTLRRSELLPGATLFCEADQGDHLYIVLAGQLEIIQALGTPDERLLGLRGSGEFVGEMSLLNPDGLRTATVRALTPAQLFEMTRADFDALLCRQPTFAYDLARALSLHLQATNNATIRDLQQKNRELARAYQELQAAQAQIIEKETLERELQVAREIQESLLPRTLPRLPGWRIAAHWQPARAVGGDFYDFLDLPDGRLGIVIGDVSGKGVPAALVMATTRSILREIAQRLVAPGQVLERVNVLLEAEMPPNMFATCLYAILDPARGRLRFANAGHDLPYRLHNGDVAELRATGMPLGLMPGMRYEEQNVTLAPGDSILLYSDGLVEAHNLRREMFGFPRLQELVGQSPSGSAALIDFLMAELAAFTGADWEQEDDITLVTLARSSSAPASPTPAASTDQPEA